MTSDKAEPFNASGTKHEYHLMPQTGKRLFSAPRFFSFPTPSQSFVFDPFCFIRFDTAQFVLYRRSLVGFLSFPLTQVRDCLAVEAKSPCLRSRPSSTPRARVHDNPRVRPGRTLRARPRLWVGLHSLTAMGRWVIHLPSPPFLMGFIRLSPTSRTPSSHSRENFVVIIRC